MNENRETGKASQTARAEIKKVVSKAAAHEARRSPIWNEDVLFLSTLVDEDNPTGAIGVFFDPEEI